jgi:Transmembrane domain of unknown function (DUF3566)
VTASEGMAATPASVGDPVLDRSQNGARPLAGAAAAPVAPSPTRPFPVGDGDGDGEVEGAERPQKLSRRERRQMRRLRARKVKRVIRHFDPWSVLKVSLFFYFCLFVVLMVAGIVLWNVAAAAGTISDIEGFFKDAGAFETFSFDGPTILRASVLVGLILVIAGTAFNVLLAVLFNLISDLVGGVRVTVIEEESARPMQVAEVDSRRA